jgi:hypothetical protein
MPNPFFYKNGEFALFPNGEEVGDSVSLVTNDNYLSTIGGVAVVESFGVVKRRFQFSTGAMTVAERDLLIEFIMSYIVGRKESFYFTNRDGVQRNVRLLDSNIEFVTNGPLYFSTKLNLEEVI